MKWAKLEWGGCEVAAGSSDTTIKIRQWSHRRVNHSGLVLLPLVSFPSWERGMDAVPIMWTLITSWSAQKEKQKAIAMYCQTTHSCQCARSELNKCTDILRHPLWITHFLWFQLWLKYRQTTCSSQTHTHLWLAVQLVQWLLILEIHCLAEESDIVAVHDWTRTAGARMKNGLS